MKLITLIILIVLLTKNTLYATNADDISLTPYEEYEFDIEFECSQYLDKNKIFIKKTEEYKEVEKVFWVVLKPDSVIDAANALYSDNMNWIYRCAVINTQIVAIQNLKKNIVNKFDKTWDIKKKLVNKMDQKIQELEEKKTFKIVTWFDESGNPKYESKPLCTSAKTKDTYHKKYVLKNTTYETCKYLYYLDYLKAYYEDINNLWLFDEDTTEDLETLKAKWANVITPWIQKDIINEKIDNSRKHAKEVFTMSFVSYTEYENNFPIHLLLQILREDFIVFRQKLHEVLNPINQVVYKIVNCQNL